VDFGLRGRVALVAGSSRGLGRAVAEELAAEGVSLILCARTEGALAEACAAIERQSGAEVVGVAADVSAPGQADLIVREGLNRFGRIDILVTNAGGPPPGLFDELGREVWEDALRLTLMSVLDLTRAVLPGMKQRRWGRILNVTSVAVKQPLPNLMLSNSLRAAVTGFAKTLADEVAPFGITVNNIMPGYTRTERLGHLAQAIARAEGVTPDEVVARWEAAIPLKRLGDPREFAAAAAFLLSERAGYITGSSLAVDGGLIRSLL
jgi:3-oxoacyl-[acyl-carrier protein] reductase